MALQVEHDTLPLNKITGLQAHTQKIWRCAVDRQDFEEAFEASDKRRSSEVRAIWVIGLLGAIAVVSLIIWGLTALARYYLTR